MYGRVLVTKRPRILKLRRHTGAARAATAVCLFLYKSEMSWSGDAIEQEPKNSERRTQKPNNYYNQAERRGLCV